MPLNLRQPPVNKHSRTADVVPRAIKSDGTVLGVAPTSA